LFAALIVPWFVNWDNYRTTFEIEAEKILGQPVRVEGTAAASILPSPSLTFTDVEVGDVGGEPMLTVDRFSVTIEMMPLLQGEIRVVAMKLERPRLKVAIDASGRADWFERSEASEALDPEKVVLEGVEISDGSLTYADARSGVALVFNRINAAVEARTLLGPWRIEGSYLEGNERVPFSFATGLRLDDGTIRVKSNFSPARFPFDVAADGVIGDRAETGLMYRGTYMVTEVDTTAADATTGEFAGLRSEGAFTLTRAELEVDKAVVSDGPPERLVSVAATLTVRFGERPSFEATAEARHIDLDRMFGGGPSEPVDAAGAVEQVAGLVSSLQIPDIPGRIVVNVPAIVVGGSVIQDVRLAARPAVGGWQIDSIRARLPGQARLDAHGMLTTDKSFGFLGAVHFSVAQPATFAAWWRGRTQPEAGRLLAAFDLAGEADIAPGQRLSVDNIVAQIGGATITGRFAWSESPRDRHRHLGTDLQADRIDFVQVKALAELLVGRNLTNTAVLADSYSVIVQAGALDVGDVHMSDVAINAGYSDDSLTVVRFGIGDIGGASFRVTGGRIDNVTTAPRGRLVAELYAPRLDGLSRIVSRFAPNAGFARWLTAAAPALAPAAFTARIAAPGEEGGTGFRIALEGAAGATAFDIVADSRGNLADWRRAPARLWVRLDSPETAGLARQVGLAAVALDQDAGTGITVEGSGVPGEGLETAVTADIAGLSARGSGKLAITADLTAAFAGSFAVESNNLDPLIAMAGLGIAGAANGTAVDVAGNVAVGADGANLEWRNGRVSGHAVGGKVRLTRASDQTWRIDSQLDVDEVDLGWMMALGLGFAPMPTGDPAAPWSKTPFISPVYGFVSGKLAVDADHMQVGEDLDIANVSLDVQLQPQRIDIDLSAGQLAGGGVTGGLSIHNVAGNANLNARFNLKGAALESFAWQLDGRSVATGEFDLSANFEATGRSPAGLVSSATGGGAFSIRDGEARYVNPNAARLVVRAADLGQQYSEDALELSFTEDIDADSLRFDQVDGAFAIAAGAVRAKNVTLRTAGVEASGNAVVDFNTLTLVSDWTLAFEPGDTKVEGTDPRVGIVFRGPLVAPSRSIDVLPLASYLNMRQEARMLEIIAMEEATRAENDRLSRLTRKLTEDDARRARKAREAAEAEARRRAAVLAAAVAVEELHVNREILAERRRVAVLRRFAETAAAEGNAAAQAAEDAARHASAERERARAADAALSRALAAENDAAKKAQETADALAEARAAAEAAERTAEAAAAEAAAADEAAAAAIAAESEAQYRAVDAVPKKEAADAAVATAAAEASSVGGAADEAEGRAAKTTETLESARAVVVEADAALGAAERVLSDAEAGLAAAQVAADEKNQSEAMATDAANAATIRKQEADDRAVSAGDDVAAAAAARDAASERVKAAQAAAETAVAAAEEAESIARQAAVVAASLLGDEDRSEQTSTTARDMEALAASRAAERRKAADVAQRAAAATRAHRDLAEATLLAAKKTASQADAAAAAAAEAADAAAALSRQAAADNQAALEVLVAASATRDAATTEVSVRKATVEAAAGALAEAEAAASAAAAVAAAASAEANSALDAKSAAEAEAARAASALATAEQALAAASAAKTAVLSAQEAARGNAGSARAAAEAASALMSERLSANEAAETALAQARDESQAAQRDKSAADFAVREAVDAAKTASAEAQAKAAAADAASEAAERAAQEVGPFDTGAASPVPVPVPSAMPKPRPDDGRSSLARSAEPLAITPVR